MHDCVAKMKKLPEHMKQKGTVQRRDHDLKNALKKARQRLNAHGSVEHVFSTQLRQEIAEEFGLSANDKMVEERFHHVWESTCFDQCRYKRFRDEEGETKAKIF